MKIKATIEKIPGGLMLVPLLLGAILNTFAPETGNYFGGFTKGLIGGTVPILAVWFFLYRCLNKPKSFRYCSKKIRYIGFDKNCSSLVSCVRLYQIHSK